MAKIIYNGEYEKKAITDQFVENLGGMLEKDPDVIYLDADLMFAFGAGLWDLGDKYPERVIRCGIAEANMVGTAAAMSVMGMKPIIHSFASFITRRAFDQIFLSGAYGRKTLNIIGSEPGYKQTYWGGTHMAFEDIAMMRTVPNAHIFDIVDGVQFNKLISKTVDMKGIYYYRTPLADNIAVYDENELVGYIDCVSNGVTDAYIQDLMVNPKQQGKGIGTELMNRMIGYLKDNHIYMISVIFEENLMPFYNNFGFNIMLSGQLETYNSNF